MGLAGQTFDLDSRRRRFDLLSQELSGLEDGRLIGGTREGRQSAWGATEVIDIAGHKVFVKRIPLTEIERSHMRSTRNLYNLPTFFNYGIGSVGLSIFRELEANVKCTEWVLNGEYPNFPLMYHYRVLPIVDDLRAPDVEADQGFVSYWAGNKAIELYMHDRCNAKHELVLFMEYFPVSLDSWIVDNPGQIQAVIDVLFRTADFLSSKGVIHFDAHFQNVVTDGEVLYLTDFGLVLDREFELSEDEKAFFDAHAHFDYARIAVCLGYQLYSRYCGLSETDQLALKSNLGIPAEANDRETSFAMVKQAERLSEYGFVLDSAYLEALLKYREVYVCMYQFSTDLIQSSDKSVRFPDEQVRGFLTKVGAS
jgi:hypothetical protein